VLVCVSLLLYSERFLFLRFIGFLVLGFGFWVLGYFCMFAG
jgi:hypothetical protein